MKAVHNVNVQQSRIVPKTVIAEKVAQSMEKAMKGVVYGSEAEYPYTAVFAMPSGMISLTGPAVFDSFKSQIEKFFVDDGCDISGGLAFEAETADESKKWLTDNSKCRDPRDSDDVMRAKAWQQLSKIVAEDLTAFQVIRVGPKDGSDGSLVVDGGLYVYLFVGPTQDGSLAGLITGSVET